MNNSVTQRFLHVALAIPKRRQFEFRIDEPVAAGCRVRVPFGNRTLVGIALNSTEHSQWPVDKIRPIIEVIDPQPPLSTALFGLIHWASRYYHHPLGETLFTALPAKLRQGEAITPETRNQWHLTEKGLSTEPASLARAPKQRNLLEALRQGPIWHSDMHHIASAAICNALKDKELIERRQIADTEGVDWASGFSPAPALNANMEQGVAISAIIDNLDSFSPSLIEGVTGSGKTEVYLQVMTEVLGRGRQVLVLVPEIGLTPQTLKRFADRLKVPIGALHSGMTDAERMRVWQRARHNQLAVVVATRSGVFTDFADLGMIIVDEEHDGSYKQQDGLKYHARDVALKRAQLLQIPLVLGTATPSLESLNNALNGRYRHLQLLQRAGNAVMPLHHLQDIKGQSLTYGLSREAQQKIRQHLSKGNQVMLFINRRGYAPALVCGQCGQAQECHSCERSFTLHKGTRQLQCHHCGKAEPVPRQCQCCGAAALTPVGMGTEQLEEGISALFADYQTARIDSDSVRSKARLTQLLDDINRRRYQLLIGTQILAKGHHFPHVSLVVILDVDGALFSADFRAPEHLAQLVTQVAGRAGRAEHRGELWLQSLQPGHPLLQDLLHNGYAHFARLALKERAQCQLPPYNFQALFRAESHSMQDAHAFLVAVRQLFEGGVGCIGPLPSAIEKRQGRYRLQLLLQSRDRNALHRALNTHIGFIEEQPLSAKVRWSLDVDPQDFS